MLKVSNMKDILTLFRDLREAYREAHQKWVNNEYRGAVEALTKADHISFLLQLALKKAQTIVNSIKGK